MSLVDSRKEPLGADEESSDSLARYRQSFFRADIQGLRAISALMIMVFHIWTTRVSGGVDVFIVLSGFLMTSVLLREAAVRGRVRPVAFYARIARRIFPSAYTVLIATLLLSAIVIAPPLWKYGVTEFVASAAHIENLELIRVGASYLDREAPPSQFQQFWALSVQMQFYVFLPFLLLALTWISRRVRSVLPLVIGLASIVAASFAFAIREIGQDPAGAYFHPAARAWEFAAGGLVAVFYPWVQSKVAGTSSRWVAVAGTAGLAGFLLCGVLVGDGQFPGTAALLPVGAAVLLLVTGASSAGPAHSILSHPRLVFLGSFSFTVYLWHWPLLVFAQHLTGTTRVGPVYGVMVIALAVVLAYATHQWVEEPTRHAGKLRPWRDLVVFGTVAAIVAAGGWGVRSVVTGMGANTPGVAPVAGDMKIVESIDFPLSKYVGVDYDRPYGVAHCLNMRECDLGDAAADRLIVVIGASHSAQWVEVVDALGRATGYRVQTYLNSEDMDHVIQEMKPDVVVMSGTATAVGDDAAAEDVPDNYVTQWRELTAAGIDVVGIRDNPRFDHYQNACVWSHSADLSECSLDRSKIFAPVNPMDEYTSTIEGLHAVDLTDLYCAPQVCPPVGNDTFIYYDRHHFSHTFLGSIEDEAIRRMSEELPALFGSALRP